MSHHQLDARNLFCPLPVIRLQDAVRGYTAGDTVDVVATDPGALNDVPAWCRVHGHRVLATRQEGNEVHIEVEVAGGE